MTTALLKFPGIDADAVISSNINVGSVSTLLIRGTAGELIVHDLPLSRPLSYEIRLRDANNPSPDDQERKITKYDHPIPHHGMHWEADEIARLIKGGELQSQRVPWDDSILSAEILDGIRSQAGIKFPAAIEKV